MRIEPRSNVDNRRTVSERISGVLDFLLGLEGFVDLLAILAGIGCLGYVLMTWTLHFLQQERYGIGALISVIGLLVAGAALIRVPAAVIAVLGGAVVCAMAFFGGMDNVLLP